MAEPHLDHPGDLRWFDGHGPAPVLGPCPHDCSHERTAAIAYGPDHAHYVLDECRDPAGCAGRCRAWFGEWPAGNPTGRYRPPGPHDWLHVDTAGALDALAPTETASDLERDPHAPSLVAPSTDTTRTPEPPTVTVAGRTYTAAPGLDGLLATLGVLQPGQHAYLPVAEPEPRPPAPAPSPVDDDLRDRIAAAIAEADGRYVGLEPLADLTYPQMADVALSVVSPLLAKRSTVAVWDPPWVCDCPGETTDPARAHDTGCGGIARTVEHRQEWMTRAVERRQSHARVVTELTLLRWLHAEACWQRDAERASRQTVAAEVLETAEEHCYDGDTDQPLPGYERLLDAALALDADVLGTRTADPAPEQADTHIASIDELVGPECFKTGRSSDEGCDGTCYICAEPTEADKAQTIDQVRQSHGLLGAALAAIALDEPASVPKPCTGPAPRVWRAGDPEPEPGDEVVVALPSGVTLTRRPYPVSPGFAAWWTVPTDEDSGSTWASWRYWTSCGPLTEVLPSPAAGGEGQ